MLWTIIVILLVCGCSECLGSVVARCYLIAVVAVIVLAFNLSAVAASVSLIRPRMGTPISPPMRHLGLL